METSADVFGTLGDPSKSRARRSGMEIVCDVLQVLSEGSLKPTHVLYRANLSWHVLTTSLEFLIKKGMVREEKEGKRTIYVLTENGRYVLRLYDALRSGLAGMSDGAPKPILAEFARKGVRPLEQKPVPLEASERVHYTF